MGGTVHTAGISKVQQSADSKVHHSHGSHPSSPSNSESSVNWTCRCGASTSGGGGAGTGGARFSAGVGVGSSTGRSHPRRAGSLRVSRLDD